MRTEFIVAKEAATLLHRDFNKYKRGVVGMYLLSGLDWQAAQVFRKGYFFMRNIDDVLDRDRPIKSDPLSYVQDLRKQVETGNYQSRDGVSILAKDAIQGLERYKRLEDNPRLDFLRAIDGVVFDYERSQKRKVLPAAELKQYFFDAFDPVVNLSLMALSPTLRTKDMPLMSYAQGITYAARDLATDWTRGTLNIPAEVLQKAGLTSEDTPSQVEDSQDVRLWFMQLFSETRPQIMTFRGNLKRTESAAANFIFGGLIDGMLSIIDGYGLK